MKIPIVPTPRGQVQPSNQIVMLVDDVGPDQISLLDAYNHYTTAYPYADLPWLGALFRRGVMFPNFWCSDLCSPTRVQVASGQYPFRTGCGDGIIESPTPNYAPPIGTLSLPGLVRSVGQQAYAMGKYHMGNASDTVSGDFKDCPNDAGFEHFSGHILNIGSTPAPPFPDHENWYQVKDGVQNTQSVWTDIEHAAEAVTLLSGASADPLYIHWGASGVHGPWNWPPSAYHNYGVTEPGAGERNLRFRAILETWDYSLGQLMQNMDKKTLADTVFYIAGDNGTAEEAMNSDQPPDPDTSPYDSTHFKLSPYEQGQKAWLLVSGPIVNQPGRYCEHWVDAVDLYETVRQVAGISPRERDTYLGDGRTIDGVSILPHLRDPDSAPTRTFSLSMSFGPNAAPPWDISQATDYYRIGYRRLSDNKKLVRQNGADDEEYDLTADPLETVDISSSRDFSLRHELEVLLES